MTASFTTESRRLQIARAIAALGAALLAAEQFRGFANSGTQSRDAGDAAEVITDAIRNVMDRQPDREAMASQATAMVRFADRLLGTKPHAAIERAADELTTAYLSYDWR